MKVIQNFSVSNFLHRVLAVQKREISLPAGSQTAQSGDLGIVERDVKTRTLTFNITFFAFRRLWTKDLPKYLRGKHSHVMYALSSQFFAFSLRTFLF